LSTEDFSEFEALFSSPLARENILGVPIYKGMAACPYCLLDPDENMVIRGIDALMKSIAREFSSEEIVRAILIAALDERNRNES
jgi:hypothetical protein